MDSLLACSQDGDTAKISRGLGEKRWKERNKDRLLIVPLMVGESNIKHMAA